MTRRSFLQLMGLASASTLLAGPAVHEILNTIPEADPLPEFDFWLRLDGIDLSRWVTVLRPPEMSRKAINVTCIGDTEEKFIVGPLHITPVTIQLRDLPMSVGREVVEHLGGFGRVRLEFGHRPSGWRFECLGSLIRFEADKHDNDFEMSFQPTDQMEVHCDGT